MMTETLSYRPTLDPEEIKARLGELLIPGTIDDRDLTRRIDRLEGRFRVYTACSPFGLWAPGLAITRDMRGGWAASLPLEEVRNAFKRLVSLTLKFEPALAFSA